MENNHLTRYQAILALVSIAGFVAITILAFLAAKFGAEWAQKMMDTILPVLIGCWATNFSQVMGYYFGNSASRPKAEPPA